MTDYLVSVFGSKQARIKSRQNNSLVNQLSSHGDILSHLPVNIRKKVLSYLDDKSLRSCINVNEIWKRHIEQFQRDTFVKQRVKEHAMLLQSQKDGSNSAVTSVPPTPNYACDTDVRVPNQLNSLTNQNSENASSNQISKFVQDNHKDTKDTNQSQSMDLISWKTYNMQTAYRNVDTRNVIIEERNVFCGAYSVLLIVDGSSRHKGGSRTTCYNGGELVGLGGSQKSIQLCSVEGQVIGNKTASKVRIHGHSGTVTVMKFISDVDSISDKSKDKQLLSGSFDTTIRRWSTETGKCLKIYFGHMATVTCLAVAENQFVSGSKDMTCRIWSYQERKCVHIMRHNHGVTSVAMSEKCVVSGDNVGLIKVWSIANGAWIKNLSLHTMDITALDVDNYHIVSCSRDCFALLWSAASTFSRCVGCFRHPKPVLCMKFMYLRAITASEDGRIRVWNVLNGQCLRLLRGNSKSDPIFNMDIVDNRIVLNTISNVIVINFEPIIWQYDCSVSPVETKLAKQKSISPQLIEQRNSSSKRSLRRSIQSAKSTRQQSEITERSKSCLSSSRIKFRENKMTHQMNPEQLESYTGRRLSYGFEKTQSKTDLFQEEQEHMSHNDESLQDASGLFVKVDDSLARGAREVKQILRQHIRSSPERAAEAMPDYVKSMVSEMKISANAGFSEDPLDQYLHGSPPNNDRRNSGPGKINTREKISVRNIYIELQSADPDLTLPGHMNSLELAQEEEHRKQVMERLRRSKSTEQSTDSSYVSQPAFSTSFHTKYASSIPPKLMLAKVTIPANYREALLKHRKELQSKRPKPNISPATTTIPTQNPIVIKIERPIRSKKHKQELLINNLGLRTYHDLQSYVENIERQKQSYDRNNELKERLKRKEIWLEKATSPANYSFDKDVIKKRPRSAKI